VIIFYYQPTFVQFQDFHIEVA